MKRARAIAPDMPELLRITAEEHQITGNWLEADRLWLQINDEYGHAISEANRLYGKMLIDAGRSSDALSYLQRAKRLNPMDPGVSLFLSLTLYNLKRMDEGLAEARRGQTLEGLDAFFIAIEKKIVSFEDNDRPWSAAIMTANFPGLAELLLMDDNETVLSELKIISKGADIFPLARLMLADIASELGDTELAFENIRALGEDLALTVIWWPIHRAIRKLPTFKTYIRERGLYDYWLASGNWGDFCRPVGDDDFECD